MSADFKPATSAHAPFVNTLIDYLAATAENNQLFIGDRVKVSRTDDRDEDTEGVVFEVKDEGYGILLSNGEHKIIESAWDCTVLSSPATDALWTIYQNSWCPDGVAQGDTARWDFDVESFMLNEPNLMEGLNTLYDTLCQAPADYHPGSNGVVRDLVHPSLYCYVNAEEATLADGRVAFDRWGRPYESSQYQWLPAEVDVDANGRAKFASYINNLENTGTNYRTIERALNKVLPLFESVYGYAQAFKPYNDEGGYDEDAQRHMVSTPVEPVSLKDRRLQVIVKMVQYEIRPDQEAGFEMTWHVEGMSHEHIVATAVLEIEHDRELGGGALQFKRGYTEGEALRLQFNSPQLRTQAINEIIDRGEIPLGTLHEPYGAGRVTVFPNSHIHRVTPMKRKSYHTSARETVLRRRILVFWLVDPEVRIRSTADVYPQQDTMSREVALQNRLNLMEERRLSKQTMNVRAVSLCEH